MHRTISARQTGLLKGISIVWIGAFTAATLMLFLINQDFKNHARASIPPFLKWLFLIATIAGTLLLYAYAIRLKQVAIAGAGLVISTRRRTAVIPFREIEAVHQNRWLSTRPVTIQFRNKTAFGRSVIFMPELRWTGTFAPVHPIVAELRTAAAGNVISGAAGAVIPGSIHSGSIHSGPSSDESSDKAEGESK